MFRSEVIFTSLISFVLFNKSFHFCRLDNIRFRRGSYGRFVNSTRHDPSQQMIETTIEKENNVKISEIIQETQRTVHHNSPEIVDENVDNVIQERQFNGIVNTVFGERLRKRLLESDEAERRQRREQSSKKAIETLAHNDKKNLKPRANDIKLDLKVNDGVGTHDHRPSLSSVNSSSGKSHCDRKRSSEDKKDMNNPKRLKSSDDKNGYHENGRNGNEKTRNGSKNASNIESDDKLCEDIATDKKTPSQFYVVDEYRAPDNDTAREKKRGIVKAEDNEIEDRHNRVAMRLMLLAEGIDPDIRTNDCAKNEGVKVIEEKKQEEKKKKSSSRSRSRIRDLKTKGQNSRSQSITPDEYYKSGKRDRQWDNRGGDSRDRFDRRRDSKNRDGDNLSEFSKEIYDLKERFEHRIGNRSSDRAKQSGSFNRHKRSEDKSHRNGRSRTPESCGSGSKERIVHRSKDDNRDRKSRSREKYKSRSSKERHCNVDTSIQHSKSVGLTKTERSECPRVYPSKETNAETKSLTSLEDGEIVDSADSSPRKLVDSTQSSAVKNIPVKPKLSDPAELELKETDVRSSLPLRDSENSRSTDSIAEKLVPHTPDSNRSEIANDCLNSSKDERIENIAEFIANFSTNQTSESSDDKEDTQTSSKTTEERVSSTIQCDVVAAEDKLCEEKLENLLSTACQSSAKDSPVESPPMITGGNNLNDDNCHEDWRLIAIDSPVKNFEENRQNRIKAINAQVMEDSELLINISVEKPPLEDSKNTSETLCVVESTAKTESEESKVISPAKPLLLPTKNDISTTKPVVLRALRSIYRRDRRKMVLSDTNSEQYAKMLFNNLKRTSPQTQSETKTANRNKDDDNKSASSENIEKCEKRPESPVFTDVDQNSNISGDVCKTRQSLDAHCGDDELKNANPELDSYSKTDVKSISINRIDENNESSKINDIKMSEETSTKIEDSLNVKLELCSYREMERKSPGIGDSELAKSIASDSKTESRNKKFDEDEETSISTSINCSNESAADVPKAKVEVINSKVKKDPQKLMVLAKRRKLVRLEDNSTSLGTTGISNSLSESVNSAEKIADEKVETAVSPIVNSEVSIKNDESQKPINIATDESPNDHPA